MTLQEKVEFAKTAIARVFNDPKASADERRAALHQLRAELDIYINAIPPKTFGGSLLEQYRAEKKARGE